MDENRLHFHTSLRSVKDLDLDLVRVAPVSGDSSLPISQSSFNDSVLCSTSIP